MKYIKYVLGEESANIEDLMPDNKHLRKVAVLATIPVAIVGIAILSGILIIAVVADGGRYCQLKYIYYVRRSNKSKRIDNILNSLDVREPNKTILKKYLNEL